MAGMPASPEPAPARAPASWQRWTAVASLVIVAAVWWWLAARHARHGVVWSVDSGVRQVQTKALLAGGSPIFIEYDDDDIDPKRRLYPMSQIFMQRSAHGYCYIYPPLYPLLNALPYRLFGWPGLFVLPLLAGLAAICVTTGMAFKLGMRWAAAVPIALGLATPLAIYSTVFWDHSLQMLLVACAAALVFAGMRGRPLRFGLAAGVVLGLGAWVHAAVIIAWVAALAAFAPALRDRRARRLAAGVLAGGALVLVAWALWNMATFGSPIGVHGAATAEASKLRSPIEMFAAPRLATRTVAYLFGGALAEHHIKASMGMLYVLLGFWLLAAMLCAAISRTRLISPVFWLLAAEAAWRGSGLNMLNHGLFAATPLLIPAVSAAWLWRPGGDGASRQFVCWAARVCLVFAVGVIVAPGYPGTDWGNRFLLTVLPLLGVLSLAAMEGAARSSRPAGRALTAVFALALAAFSATSQWHGDRGVRHDLAKMERLVRVIEREPADVVLTNAVLFGAAASNSPAHDRIVLVGDDEDMGPMVRLLDRRKCARVSYLGTEKALGRVRRALLSADPPWRAAPVRAGEFALASRFTREGVAAAGPATAAGR